MSENIIGISSFVFESPFTDHNVDWFDTCRDMGYGLIEIAYERPERLSPATIGRSADGAGMKLAIAAVTSPTSSLANPDSRGRIAAMDYLCRTIDFAAEVGATTVAGPIYAAAGTSIPLSVLNRAESLKWAADGLRAAGEYADSRNVSLAIEALNRFETSLVTTVDETIALCDAVGLANVGISLDTFHMNIEEKDTPAAIICAADHLLSFQASESDRGTVGTGQVPWPNVMASLDAISYGGPIIVESFRWDIPGLAQALALWRPLARSPISLAQESLLFLEDAVRITSSNSMPTR